MSRAQELHSLSELRSGDSMEASQFVDNIIRAKRSKRSRPPFSVLTASGEEQSFCSSLSEISLQEEEEEEEEKQHLAAYSLMMLAHAHGITSHSHPSQPSSAGTVKLLLPTKRKIKKPKQFNEAGADSFDDGKGEGEKKYKCKTCSKKFFSFQALGGHRASCYNKYKSLHNEDLDHETTHDDGAGTFLHSFTPSKQCENPTLLEKVKVHECPICYRVFASGQALGGHKRSHNTPPCNTASISTTDHSPSPQRHAEAEYELDLNMPPPDVDCIEREESVSVWPHYAKANYNFSPYWWTESSEKRVPSVYNGVVVGRDDEYEADSKAVGFKPDLFLVAPVN